ncbi:hypothetical protein D3C83_111300 [compost metagenome]
MSGSFATSIIKPTAAFAPAYWLLASRFICPFCDSSNCFSVIPISELPQRRWWSRKDSGAPSVKQSSHSDTLASSTAIGFRSTP